MASRVLLLIVVLAFLVWQSNPIAADGGEGVTLTVLHHNDASSGLVDAGPGLEAYGGVARFKTLVDVERGRAAAAGGVAILVSGGNTLLVGPALEASIETGAPFYDATAMLSIGYDAAAIGNQDFDLGPDILADFLCGIVRTGGGTEHPGCAVTGRSDFPFLSANLDFSGEPRLQELVELGGIARSTVVTKDGQAIGIVGVTTPLLLVISSPAGVTVMSNMATLVQAEVDAFTARGVDKIVLLSQLSSLEDEVALTEALRGVDVVVGGGTDIVMANPGDLLVPGDMATQSYPVYATAADGANVPIVTTVGSYKYLGRLVVEFDAAGRVERIDPGSGPLRVADEGLPDGVRADAILLNAVTEPVQAFLDSLAISEIALSEVRLDGREQTIRTRETNLGNLMADAVLWQARAAAGEFGAPEADVAIVNAGAFRLNVLKDAGPLTRLDAFDIAPFASFVSVVEDVSPAELKLLVENSLSSLLPDDGRFGQIAGFRVTYDASGEALRFDTANHPLNTGARVLSIQLDNGTHVVQDGAVVPGAPAVAVATIDFLARGGDRYPFAGGVTNLGVSYQQALESYLLEALGGVIRAGEYPEGGEGRIVAE